MKDPGFTVAAIDDIIERRKLSDWVAFGMAVDEDASVETKVQPVVETRSRAESPISHGFRRARATATPEIRSSGID